MDVRLLRRRMPSCVILAVSVDANCPCSSSENPQSVHQGAFGLGLLRLQGHTGVRMRLRISMAVSVDFLFLCLRVGTLLVECHVPSAVFCSVRGFFANELHLL